MFKLRLLALAGLLLLQACATNTPDPAARILGSWESRVGEFTVVTTYSESEVSIDDHDPLPYVLEDNRLIIDGDQVSARLLSFPGRNEMVQTEPMTGTTHRYERRP